MAKMLISMVLMFVLFVQWTESTAENYESKFGCDPPSLTETYMSERPKKGTALSLTLNGIPLEKFKGFSSGEEYKMVLLSPEYNQYIIFMDQGTLDHDLEMINCGGKQLVIGSDEKDVEFSWVPPEDGAVPTLTVGYAPGRTSVAVQTFQIPSASAAKKEI
eukprot:171390_1